MLEADNPDTTSPLTAPPPPAAAARASRIYAGIDRVFTLAGLLRIGAKMAFQDPIEADGFRNGVALVADIIEQELTPLLNDAVELCGEVKP